MNFKLAHKLPLTLSLLATTLCLTATVIAQVPVVDAAGTPGRQSQNQSVNNAQNSSQNNGNDLILSLYNQLEQLQREMQTLRGMVEEQSYEIRRMQNEQRDRYLDIDSRLSNMGGGVGTGVAGGAGGAGGFNDPASPVALPGGVVSLDEPIPATGQPSVAGNTSTSGSNPQNLLPATPANEQTIYRNALNLLLEDGNFEESISQFQHYIDNYPAGSYLTNSWYWQGEALILAGRYNDAEQAFRKVVDEHPNDPKAAGALLKIGVAYNQSGSPQRARETWESIRTRYPDSLTEIRTAQDYLDRLGNQ